MSCRRFARSLCFGLSLIAFCGAPASAAERNIDSADAAAVRRLRGELIALSPRVRHDEAQRVAVRAHQKSRQLGREYRVVGPPQFHNFLVNAGIRKRGLCHQWARDLMHELRGLRLTTLELHWGAARAGTLREHNCVVITAKGQEFAKGIVLDAWRRSGRLFTHAVNTDRYPWKEDVTECFCRRRRSPVASEVIISTKSTS